MEGEGSSQMEHRIIDTAADTLDGSVIFHVINEISGFVLYMHQQIPSILQDISLEFNTLQTEYKELGTTLTESELKASCRRTHMSRMREVRQGIKRLEKLMNSVNNLQSALKLMVREIPNVQEVILVVGASPLRSQHVYELSFLHGKTVLRSTDEFTKSKVAEGLSRKAIRTLISKGAGSGHYPGPTKLFLLVKAPTSFNLPLHFLPKRDFRYSKKTTPFCLRFKCRTQGKEMDASEHNSQTGNSIALTDSSANDLIWFQCRHVVKGLALNTSVED